MTEYLHAFLFVCLLFFYYSAKVSALKHFFIYEDRYGK